MLTTDTIAEAIETNINKMFTEVAREYELKYGDIAPEQVAKLDDIKQDLADILGDYVHQNIEEDN